MCPLIAYETQSFTIYVEVTNSLHLPEDPPVQSLTTLSLADLNEMQVREPRKMIDIARDADTKEYFVEVKPDLADDILVVGPRHHMDDFRCRPANKLGFRTSGVCSKRQLN